MFVCWFEVVHAVSDKSEQLNVVLTIVEAA